MTNLHDDEDLAASSSSSPHSSPLSSPIKSSRHQNFASFYDSSDPLHFESKPPPSIEVLTHPDPTQPLPAMSSQGEEGYAGSEPQPPLGTSRNVSDHSSSASLRWYQRYRFSKVQFALIGLLSVQTITTISVLSATVSKIQKEIQTMNPQLKTISTYLAIFIIANIFSIIMAIDLLLNKNVVQLIALDLFNISMAVYGAVLPVQIKRSLHTPGGAVSWNGARVGTSCNMYLSCYGVQYLYEEIEGWIIAIPVITGLCSVLMGYLTWLIYKEFGWEIFKQIGADLALKRILQRKYLFYMLQKFVFFFFVGFSLQFLMLGSDISTVEKVLTIAAVPFSLLVILLGGVAVRNEIKWMLGVYYLVWTGAMVYFVYKLNRLYHNDSISSAVKSLTIFSVLTILLLFATGVMAGLCYLEFGRGLLATPAGLNESVWLKMIKAGFRKTSADVESSQTEKLSNRRTNLDEPPTANVTVQSRASRPDLNIVPLDNSRRSAGFGPSWGHSAGGQKHHHLQSPSSLPTARMSLD